MSSTGLKASSRADALTTSINEREPSLLFGAVLFDAIGCPCLLPAASAWAKVWKPKSPLARAVS
jgi:hypothetical protein